MTQIIEVTPTRKNERANPNLPEIISPGSVPTLSVFS